MASSSSSPSTSQSKKYDVFISFRGTDVREGFLSHLHDAFLRSQINVFVDESLERGNEITPSLLKTIEESHVLVVILSEKYADSPWCLDELVKIYECYRTTGQTVLPIFYHVDPSHAQELSGSFGVAIDKHRQGRDYCVDRVENWSHALTEISNLSGWDSRNIKPDSKLIREVVSQIQEKINNVIPSIYYINGDGLVGTDSRVKDIMSLLSLESTNVQVVGIWGMGGIGKTTIAKQVFYQIQTRFPLRLFVADVREKIEKYGNDFLEREIRRSRIATGNLNAGSLPILSSPLIWRRLSKEKILILLDDVSDLDQIEFVQGNYANYCSGSRIIITSRDQQLLKNMDAEIYEVKKLDNSEALHLFSLHSFKQNHPKNGYAKLSSMAVTCAGGIPLALKVFGSNLYGKSIEEWEGELEKLKGNSDQKIQRILRISFDGLDEKEKQIFLDIACFFKGGDRDGVTKILDGCGFFAKSGIIHLIDKSLVTISRLNKLHMHDLLQQMGKDIVCKEKELGKRTRLWYSKDIFKVFTRDMGTEITEGISLDHMSEIGYMELSSKTFAKMYNLRLLKFSKHFGEKNKILIPEGLEYISDELRFLHWDGFPMESLPFKILPQCLFELRMCKSQLKQLWTENQGTLANLILIDLSWSKNLISIPDLSTTPNLEDLILCHCSSLVEIPSSVKKLSKLRLLNVEYCTSLGKLPRNLAVNITELELSGTAIKQLPSSIGCLSKLCRLNLARCKELQSLPDSLCNLKSLQKLLLDDCVNVNGLPEKFGDLESLVQLHASRSGIKKLPCSINQLRRVEVLDLRDCHISEFPVGLCSITSIVELYLQGNDFEIIPERFKQLTNLLIVNLNNCKRLKYLHGLPSSLSRLSAKNCLSLESAPASHRFTEETNYSRDLDFSNCFNLNEVACSQLMDHIVNAHEAGLRMWSLCIPGNEIVKRIKYQNNNGSSLSFRLEPFLHFDGVSFCAVVTPKVFYPKLEDSFSVECRVKLTDDSGFIHFQKFSPLSYRDSDDIIQVEHVHLWGDQNIDLDCANYFTEASFEFCVINSDDNDDDKLMVIKCGVHPIFKAKHIFWPFNFQETKWGQKCVDESSKSISL